ncbi:TIGR00730 family Rossman fold protein [uncultured Cohaesibacter sp.]|uniref:LOG family protein n=1 Tax=uncultured Cohaesibacter sp. TaxID=1002546 RepID=UPI002AA65569|nr:TIGR00730 family Rossman fold protein [uncultured Cohaesibacter sp.]
MSKLHNICVYCGSGSGKSPVYAEAARALGVEMAKAGIRLVYGGGAVGLMGILAKSVLDNGGNVTGIIPEFLQEREVMLDSVQDLIVTQDMHERKRKMFDAAQAFVALPGGIGTLEEVVEMLTWAQLGQHKKPILLANIDGFWDPLARLFDHMEDEAFFRQGMGITFLTAKTTDQIVPMLREALASIPEDELSGTSQSSTLNAL